MAFSLKPTLVIAQLRITSSGSGIRMTSLTSKYIALERKEKEKKTTKYSYFKQSLCSDN